MTKIVPCCGYSWKEDSGTPYPVMWNPFNAVVQCHNCGHIWEPATYGLDKDGCKKQVAQWLMDGTYRVVMHRHDGNWRAIDEAERKLVNADTLPLLADALMNWPEHGASYDVRLA